MKGDKRDQMSIVRDDPQIADQVQQLQEIILDMEAKIVMAEEQICNLRRLHPPVYQTNSRQGPVFFKQWKKP